MPRKKIILILAYYPVGDQYKVIRVKNSIKHKPGEFLEADKVQELINKDEYDITVETPR